MTVVEGVTVGAVVVGAVAFVARRFIGTANAEKGSCKGCGDSCSCVVSSVHKSSTGSAGSTKSDSGGQTP